MYKTIKLSKYYEEKSTININYDFYKNINYNIKLGDYKKIDKVKNKIENVNQDDWVRIRKYTNVYESPYTNTFKKPISRAFYKLWEMLYDFKIECNSESLHLCEAPGGFVQATLEYKIKKYNDVKKCHTMSLIVKGDPNVPKYHQNLSNNPNVNIIKKDNGDLYNTKNIVYLCDYFKNSSISFITSDGGITDNGDYNNKEITHTKLILSQIYTSCCILKDFGNFILKIFDIFTDTTSHILYLLNIIFTDVYITKPLTSRPTNSEKYLVCKGFIKSKFNDIIKNKLFDCLVNTEKDFCVIKIFDNIPQRFTDDIKKYNDDFILHQTKYIEKNLNLLKDEKQINVYDFMCLKKNHAKNWLIKYRLV